MATRKKKKINIGKPSEYATSADMAKAFMNFSAGSKDHKDLDKAASNSKNWTYIDFIDPYTDLPCLPLEYLFGCRGFLAGRIMKVQAYEGVGKSSFLALCYGMGMKTAKAMCMLEESEKAEFPQDRLADLGCNPDALLHNRISSLANCLNHINIFITDFRNILDKEMKYPMIIGVDSLSSLAETAQEADENILDNIDIGKSQSMGLHARTLSIWFRNGGSDVAYKNKALIIFTAQFKKSIKTGFCAGYGPPKDTTLGGKAVEYHSSFILNLKATPFKANDIEVGTQVQMYLEKNKVSPAHRAITMNLLRRGGWQPNSGLAGVIMAARNETDGQKLFNMSVSGGWYSWPQLTDKKFRSDELPELLYSNEDFLMSVRESMYIRGYGFDFETKWDKKEESSGE